MKKDITKEEFEKLYNEWYPKFKSLGLDNLKFQIMRTLYGEKIKETFQQKKDFGNSLENFENYEKLCKETKKDVLKNELELKILNDNEFEIYFNKSLKCKITDYYEGKTKHFIMYNLLCNKKSDTYEREISSLIANQEYNVTKIKFNPTFDEIIDKFLPQLK